MINEEMYMCEYCEGTGFELSAEKDACRRCGGYGFSPGGDIREAILEARVVLGKVDDVRPFQRSHDLEATPSQDRTP